MYVLCCTQRNIKGVIPVLIHHPDDCPRTDDTREASTNISEDSEHHSK